MKKKILFYKYFLPIFLFGSLLVIIFCLVIYKTMAKDLQRNYMSDKTSYVTQLKSNIEQKVKTIEFSFSSYASTKSFSQNFEKPLSSSEYPTYADIRNEINYLATMSGNDNDFNLISLNGKWGIINGSLKQLSDEKITEYRKNFTNQERSLFWMKTNNGIEMTITLPMFKKEKIAVGNAFIDRNSLDKLVNDSNDFFFILSDGQLLYQSKEGSIPKELLQLSKTNEKQRQFIEMAGKNYIVMKSDYNHWLFCLELPSNYLNDSISRFTLILCIITVILLSCLAVLSYHFSVQITRPIEKIQNSLNIPSPAFREKPLERLVDSVQSLVSQNQYLDMYVTNQRPQLEMLLVLSLFRNRIEKGEVQQKLEQFGYKEEGKVFYTAVIQIDEEDHLHDTNEKDILLLAINNIVAEIVPANDRFLPIVLNENHQATIFSFREEENHYKSMNSYCIDIQEAIFEFLNLSVSIGISQSFSQLAKAKVAVDRAKEALNYRINTGPGAIIFSEDVSPKGSDQMNHKYPTYIQNQLQEAIRLSQEEEANQLTAKLIETIYENNKTMMCIEVALMRFVQETFEFSNILGVDFSNKSPKLILTKCMNFYKAKDTSTYLFNELISPLINSFKDRTNVEVKTISDKMKDIVAKEYDQDISLEYLSEKLHYNPHYLSSVFKKETGENFVDFLQSYRLAIAKKWLEKSAMSIREIAERLQYRNSQNFIRFFKKKEGCTPGEYRKDTEKRV